ncbi:hypothetical protein GCM10010329_38120 [Streptomyces spiroverticillatus]|uniref:HTH luxR-type domain-containing protein n=1 Tax=Streptomyces finlayi TaxID=67296 RepID=A0A919CA90_9ACTN|nr:LuxR family transcriptional regulator [Streptomyces finlayi]GHA11597.1 hypothetical protein GCM10010329_38120 [Streptomyces spiroverticillatus]GHC94941.1 hypothetical protein GCM10010334_33490 [Streptomyces finlayi]
MYLVERDDHILCLGRLFRQAAEGTGAAVLIEGAPADGKTELLRRAVDEAERAGALVLHASCARAERTLAFGVLDQLLHSVRPPAPIADRLARALERAVAATATDGSGPTGPDWSVGPDMAHALRDLTQPLLELAQSAPVVVAVDDVHWGDIPSLHYLLYLIRRLRSARIVVVLTSGTEPQADPETAFVRSAFFAELSGRPHCETLRVLPLSDSGALRMARAALGAAGAARLAERLPQAAGNPLLTRALIEDARSAPGHEGRSDDAYVRAVLGLIHRGSPHGLARTAHALAVLGDGADPTVLGRVAGLDSGAVEQCLRFLTDAGVVHRGTYRRGAARQGVLHTMPAEERAELRQRAARLLHDGGAPAERVTDLLLACGPRPQPWAVPVLVESAHRERRAGSPDRAAAALELALAGTTDDRERAVTSTALAAVLWQTAPVGVHPHLDPLVRAADAGLLGTAEIRELLHQLLWHGRHEAARRVLAGLPTDGGGRAVDADLLDTLRWIAWAHPTVMAGTGEAAAWDASSHAAARFRPAFVLADALVRGRADGAVGQAEHILDEHTRLHDDVGACATIQTALTVLSTAGRTFAAARWCDHHLADGHILAPTRGALLHAVRAELALHSGDVPTAYDHAQTALDRLPPSSWGVVVGLPLSVAVLSAVRTGRTEDSAALLAKPVPQAMFDTRYGLLYLHARGHHQLATGRPYAALEDFLRCGELMRAWGIDVPGTVPWRTAAGEAWLALGNVEEAARLAGAQLALSDRAPAERGRALRLLAVSAPWDRRPALLTEALELLDGCGDQYESIRVLRDLGEVFRRLGDSTRARACTRRARRMSGAHGAALPGDALPQLPPETAPVASREAADRVFLTDSETRVAELAVRGHTNREIATKLFVSASTVEQHLTRVYKKLGVRSRKQLPAGLQGVPGRAPEAGPALAS